MALATFRPRLIVITNRAVATATETLQRFRELAKRVAPGRVAFQLRDRELPAIERLAFGSELTALAREHGQLFQVNDRLDLAALLDADSVHLGEGSVATDDARAVVGTRRFVTRAVHDPDLVADVDADGVLLSPILAARKGRQPLGLGGLRAARTRLNASGSGRLLYALGGIAASDVQACIDAGADGVAVIGAALSAPRLDELIEAIEPIP